MGRRLLLMMGIVLLASPAIPFAGVEPMVEGRRRPSRASGPAATHVALPGDLLPE